MIQTPERILLVSILLLFPFFLVSQTLTIKVKKPDTTIVNFTLAQLSTGTITVNALLADPIVRLETNKPLFIKNYVLTMSVNGRLYSYTTKTRSGLTEEELAIIEAAEPGRKNVLYLDALAEDETKKQLKLKTIALLILAE